MKRLCIEIKAKGAQPSPGAIAAKKRLCSESKAKGAQPSPGAIAANGGR